MPPNNTPLVLLVLLILHGAVLSTSSQAQTASGPQYASEATQEVIEKMIEAHGGLKTWQNAPTISYDNIFFNPFATEGPDAYPWWVSHEVFDQRTRRAYHDWPLDDAHLTYDGEDVWTVHWGNDNMPRFMAQFFYYFVNLPWLTQDNNVRLGKMQRSKLPGSGTDKDYYTVEMTFTEKPAVGKTVRDKYKLYIDPDDHLLHGYEYWIGYGPMLDGMGIPEGEIFGPMLRVHDSFAAVDGLVFPERFHTMSPDGSATYGYHVIMNHRIDAPFDEERMRKPSNAIIDTSTEARVHPK